MVKGKVSSVRNYFVDEAGDGTLFDQRGHIIVGTPGCSRYFILGLVDAPEPERLSHELEELRKRLLADPYFRKVPSMQPEANKTARAFHAKDDVPEVRREVFALILQHDLQFLAVVRDKRKVIEYVRQRNERDTGYHYAPNELYDYMVRRLFKNLLHKDDEYNIYFARRGSSDRTEALRQALEAARQRFGEQRLGEQWNIISAAALNVIPGSPEKYAGLQVVDYFLWALQRLYERHEDRYVELLWPAFRLVHDLDDTREKTYGVYYTQKKPLSLAAFKGLPGI